MSQKEFEKQNFEEQNYIPIEERRNFTVTTSKKKAVDFLIKLKHEDMRIGQFFTMILNGFIEDDPNIDRFLAKNMENYRYQYRSVLLSLEKKKTIEEQNKFNLNPDEIQDIYDFLEESEDL